MGKMQDPQMLSLRTFYSLLNNASYIMIILAGVHLGYRYFTETGDYHYLQWLRDHFAGCNFLGASLEEPLPEEGDVVGKMLKYVAGEDFQYIYDTAIEPGEPILPRENPPVYDVALEKACDIARGYFQRSKVNPPETTQKPEGEGLAVVPRKRAGRIPTAVRRRRRRGRRG
jgi:hypothetical protein